jgi:hypothetical protein
MKKKLTNEDRAELDAEYTEIMPEALSALRDIIKNPEINPIARVQAISLVTDRVLGKVKECVQIEHTEEDMDEAQKRLDEIFARARKKQE